jgi:hypothetical protein
MTALKPLSYQLVTASLRLIAEVLGLGPKGSGEPAPPRRGAGHGLRCAPRPREARYPARSSLAGGGGITSSPAERASPCWYARETCSRRSRWCAQSIPRRETLSGTHWCPTSTQCLELASRKPSWQRSCATATTDRTYNRKRSDPHSAKALASNGPSTYGSRLSPG